MITTLLKSTLPSLAASGPSQLWVEALTPESLFIELSSRAQQIRDLLSDRENSKPLWGDDALRDALIRIVGKDGFELEPHVANVLALNDTLENIEIREGGLVDTKTPIDFSAEILFQAESVSLIHKRVKSALSYLSDAYPLRNGLLKALTVSEQILSVTDTLEKWTIDTIPPSPLDSINSDIRNISAPPAYADDIDMDDELAGDDTSAIGIAQTVQEEDEIADLHLDEDDTMVPDAAELPDEFDDMEDFDFDSPRSRAGSEFARTLSDRSQDSRARSPSVLPASSGSVQFGLPPEQAEKLKQLSSSMPPEISDETYEEVPLAYLLVQALMNSFDLYLDNQPNVGES